MRTFRVFKVDGDYEDVQADYYELVAYTPENGDGGTGLRRYFLFICDATRLTDRYFQDEVVYAISLIH